MCNCSNFLRHCAFNKKRKDQLTSLDDSPTFYVIPFSFVLFSKGAKRKFYTFVSISNQESITRSKEKTIISWTNSCRALFGYSECWHKALAELKATENEPPATCIDFLMKSLRQTSPTKPSRRVIALTCWVFLPLLLDGNENAGRQWEAENSFPV